MKTLMNDHTSNSANDVAKVIRDHFTRGSMIGYFLL